MRGPKRPFWESGMPQTVKCFVLFIVTIKKMHPVRLILCIVEPVDCMVSEKMTVQSPASQALRCGMSKWTG